MILLVLGCVVVVVLLAALIIAGARVGRLRKKKKGTPVAAEGLPLVGNLVGFASGPLSFIERNFRKHGPVFSVHVMHKTLTFLIGPAASAPFFQNNDEVFSQPEVYGFMKSVFGPDVSLVRTHPKNAARPQIVYDAPSDKRRAQMQFMSRGLRADRLKSYVPKISAETRDFLKQEWGERGTLDLLNSLSELTILTSSRCLHGDDVRETLFKEVSQLYHDLDKGITPLSFFWPTAPVASHKKRDQARIEMVNLFSKVIAQRRADPKPRTDILQVFIDMQYKDGTRPTDDNITGLLIALLFAGQHTSSITSTWTLLFIAANPALKARLVEEQNSLLRTDQDPTYDDLNKMPLLHDCIKESLRMHPPLIMLMRKVMKDIEVSDGKQTYVLPKGDIAIVSPAVAGRLDAVFKDPDVFDPDRYAAPREEHKAVPFAHLGFGAGIHQCMGQQFGYMQVKTILSHILRNYDVSLPPGLPFPEPDYTAMVVGPKGHPLLTYAKKIATT
ncbi:hypothetical protein CTAYLR_002590 [Chrysophaeum taylorii]|uniref:Uncharacterized protein n=1 Tax=Chrysophaeum taylorii TaxID=2483200 RepID=A0AAD7UEZ5_9STRA|nr:hypothetical protein CTAYLR_002590 [Chrysophaeum taylorii]